MNKKTVRDIDVTNKRVLLRVDYNVPFFPGTTQISDDNRLQQTLPTINYLQERGAKIIICSHLGRPKGQTIEALRLKPVVDRLSHLLGTAVNYVPECPGPRVEEMVDNLKPGEILLLENIRFCAGEEQNDDTFALQLAGLADVYVDDAFSTAHRAHTSIERIAHYRPAVAGLLMERELEALGKVLEAPERPLVAVIGGAKIGDKIPLLKNLLDRVNVLLIGGGMAATFLRSQGLQVGESLIEEEWVALAASLLRWARQAEVALHLPKDVVVVEHLDTESPYDCVSVEDVPEGWLIADIGPQTVGDFVDALNTARTVVWNGPMGVFEVPPFDEGTTAVAQALASLTKATTVIGGGSTAEAVHRLGLAHRMSHVSTGGGAALEFLEGRVLPGIAVLQDRQPIQIQ